MHEYKSNTCIVKKKKRERKKKKQQLFDVQYCPLIVCLHFV